MLEDFPVGTKVGRLFSIPEGCFDFWYRRVIDFQTPYWRIRHPTRIGRSSTAARWPKEWRRSNFQWRKAKTISYRPTVEGRKAGGSVRWKALMAADMSFLAPTRHTSGRGGAARARRQDSVRWRVETAATSQARRF